MCIKPRKTKKYIYLCIEETPTHRTTNKKYRVDMYKFFWESTKNTLFAWVAKIYFGILWRKAVRKACASSLKFDPSLLFDWIFPNICAVTYARVFSSCHQVDINMYVGAHIFRPDQNRIPPPFFPRKNVLTIIFRRIKITRFPGKIAIAGGLRI